jgi:hypothetical protein
MPATAAHALRYPAATDPADVPSDMQKLASDVDVALIPCDTVVTAAARIVANKLLAADAQPAWRVLGSGRMDWGAGGASATDTWLQRTGANYLAISGGLYANQGSANQFNLSTDGRLYFGSANDTNLYRSAAGVLKTDGGLEVAGLINNIWGTGIQLASAAGHSINLRGDLVGGVGGSSNGIRLIIDGANYSVPIYVG